MKLVTVSVVLLLVSVLLPERAVAEVTIADMLSNTKSEDALKQTASLSAIYGMVSGIVAAQEFIVERGDKRLFCPSSKLKNSFSANDALSALRRVTLGSPKLGELPSKHIGLVMVDVLSQLYPCKN